MAKLVFVTGASSGIGQALAARFYQAGYQVALVARNLEAMRDWARSCGWTDTRFRVYRADVAVVDSVLAAARDCLAQQGLPDVVIASAGTSVSVVTSPSGLILRIAWLPRSAT